MTEANNNEVFNNSGRSPGLPQTMHILLEEAEAAGQGDIISWEANGTAFRIKKKDDFIQKLMPRYFDTASFKSFQRSINLWGFHTVRKGPLKGYTSNKLFRRGQRDLALGMKRTRIKGTGKKRGTAEGGSQSVLAPASAENVSSNTTPKQQRVESTTTSNSGCMDHRLAGSNGFASNFSFFPPPARTLGHHQTGAGAVHHDQHLQVLSVALLNQLLSAAPASSSSSALADSKVMGTNLLLQSLLGGNNYTGGLASFAGGNTSSMPWNRHLAQQPHLLSMMTNSSTNASDAMLAAMLSSQEQQQQLQSALARPSIMAASALMMSSLVGTTTSNTQESSSARAPPLGALLLNKQTSIPLPASTGSTTPPLAPAATTITAPSSPNAVCRSSSESTLSRCNNNNKEVEQQQDALIVAGLLRLIQQKEQPTRPAEGSNNNNNGDLSKLMIREAGGRPTTIFP